MGIRNLIHGGSDSTESNIPVKQIEAEIISRYNLLQHNEDRRAERELFPINPDRKVTYKCVTLQDTDDFSCNCSGQNWALKKAIIPEMMEYRGAPYIEFVGLMDNGSVVKFNKAKSVKHIELLSDKSKVPSYYLQSKNLYVFLPYEYSMICEIFVIGIPKSKFDTTGPCFDVWSNSLNIPEWMIPIIKDQIVQSFVATVLQTKGNMDIVQNAQDGNNITDIR